MGSMDLIKVLENMRILATQNYIDLNFSADIMYSFLPTRAKHLSLCVALEPKRMPSLFNMLSAVSSQEVPPVIFKCQKR